MTLAIFVERPPREGHDPKHETWSFGPETDRSELWQAPELKSLDLRLLPEIANDLLVPYDRFEELLAECERVRTRCECISEPNYRCDTEDWWRKHGDELASRMNKLREAVEFAREHNANRIEVS